MKRTTSNSLASAVLDEMHRESRICRRHAVERSIRGGWRGALFTLLICPLPGALACQEEPAPTPTAAATGTEDQDEGGAAEPATTEQSTAEQSTAADEAAKKILRDISFDDLKFDIPIGTPFKREMLNVDVKKLDGQVIKIRGYMKPNFQQSNIEKFVLVRDNQACCFGPGAAIYDCVLVMLDAGKKTEFSVRPITVSGTMYLKEYKGPDGNIWAIFRMRNAQVE